jgi:regulatory protein
LSSKPTNSIEEVVQKLEYYCSYQERCHNEVRSKLHEFSISENEKEKIIVHLINENFLNEERFAAVFSISKFHQKKWGKIRIKNELKARKISDYLITKSLKEIPETEYEATFQTLAEKNWDAITEKNALKKRKKCCDYLLRKGWESDLVYEKVKQLEHQ